MPPKQKISREDILNTAFELTRLHGFESVTARKIAEALHCSTQPIFRIYENMTDLKSDLFNRINEFFGNYLTHYQMPDVNPFLRIGVAYIDFAKNESNFFHMLFLSNNLQMNSMHDLVNNKEHSFILEMIPNSEDSEDKSLGDQKDIFMKIWLFTHGIATMIATNNIKLSNEEIITHLSQAFEAFSHVEITE